MRLLGLGHLIAWTPQIAFYSQSVQVTEGWFQYWIISVLVLNGISMVIDLVDVVRYSLGARQPM